MKIIKCDRCGKLIHMKNGNVFGSVSIWKKDASTNAVLEENAFAEWDFCEDCLDSIRNFISKLTREEKFEKIIESVDEGKKTTKKEWDKGKAQALRNAGWTLVDIAKEVGVTEATKSKNTTPAQPKKAKPNEWASAEPDLDQDALKAMNAKPHAVIEASV